MSVEDKLKLHIGDLTILIYDLQDKLEQANTKIKELEAKLDQQEKPTTGEG